MQPQRAASRPSGCGAGVGARFPAAAAPAQWLAPLIQALRVTAGPAGQPLAQGGPHVGVAVAGRRRAGPAAHAARAAQGRALPSCATAGVAVVGQGTRQLRAAHAARHACLHATALRSPAPLGPACRPPPACLLQEARAGYDVARAARMGTFGLLFYGPYQHWWYGLLARTFPGATPAMFATKARAARAQPSAASVAWLAGPGGVREGEPRAAGACRTLDSTAAAAAATPGTRPHCRARTLPRPRRWR